MTIEETNPEEYIHSGHRQRLTDEFIKDGAENFSDVRALELLLFYSIPRVDTNPTAHKLLNAFGSLQNVLSATIPELVKAGISEKSAVLIRLTSDITRKALIESKLATPRLFRDSSSVGDYVQALFQGDRDERFILICLSPQMKMNQCVELAHGIVNRVNVDVRRIVEVALAAKATSCIIAHNHPDGALEPSRDDISVTDRVRDALSVLGIKLNDHVIASPNGYYSFSEHGLL